MSQGLTVFVVAALVLVGCGSSGEQQAAGGAGTSASAGAGDDGGASAAGEGGTAGSATAGAATAGAGSQAGAGVSGTGGTGNAGAATRCTIDQAFGTPKPIAELNTPEHEAGARLTSDELAIVYLCASYDTICLARRTTRNDPFGAPQTIVATGGGVPWISDDTLTLLFEDSSSSSVRLSQRTTAQAGFPPSKRLLLGYGDPYVVAGGDGHIYVSTLLSGLEVAALSGWAPAALKPVLGGTTTSGDTRPVVTPDELTLYFSAGPPSTGTKRSLDIWVKQRKSTQDPFGAPVAVAELNTTPYNFPSWISPDGCRLYFDSGADLRDLFVAER